MRVAFIVCGIMVCVAFPAYSREATIVGSDAIGCRRQDDYIRVTQLRFANSSAAYELKRNLVSAHECHSLYKGQIIRVETRGPFSSCIKIKDDLLCSWTNNQNVKPEPAWNYSD